MLEAPHDLEMLEELCGRMRGRLEKGTTHRHFDGWKMRKAPGP
jgi:hypothetical protein